MKPKLTFETLPADMGPFFFDGARLTEAALGCEVEEGPHKGLYLFSTRARAEEFCWKNGFEPKFEQETSGES